MRRFARMGGEQTSFPCLPCLLEPAQFSCNRLQVSMTAAECVAGSVRDLLSSTLMTRRKKHGWLKTMLGLMLGCMLVVVAVFAATNVATIATTKDRIVEPQAAVGFDADAIVVLGLSLIHI